MYCMCIWYPIYPRPQTVSADKVSVSLVNPEKKACWKNTSFGHDYIASKIHINSRALGIFNETDTILHSPPHPP